MKITKLFLLILLSATSLFAEERGVNIFEKDYDMNVFNPRKPAEKQSAAPSPSPASTDTTQNPPAEQASPQATPTPVAVTKGAKKVEWLGLIVNAQNQEHFGTELKGFLDFAQANDYDIGPVYAIGKRFKTKELNRLDVQIDARGGHLKFLNAVPEKYQVKSSPAWLVGTAEGLYILEGLPNFHQKFNSSGEFYP